MSMKISMSMSEESGLPEDELLGVSCTLEIDGEPAQPQEADDFESDLCSVVEVCCQVLGEELARQRQTHVAARSSRESHGVGSDQ